MATHTERAFEDAIEVHLLAHGWLKGDAADFDRTIALDSGPLLAFLHDTQPTVMQTLRTQLGTNLEASLTDALVRGLEERGTLDVLRHGFKLYGKKLEVAAFKPAHGLNADTLAGYGANRLVVTRQVRPDPASEQSVDMVLFLNGLPIATLELKNELTQQTVQDAIRQYKSRDPRLPLFQFKRRALVHFAVDTDLVAMTTRLAGKDTVFLPFNRGHGGGKGNPPHPSGHRTAYLWEEVLQRDSFLDLLARFLHLQVEEKEKNGKKEKRESLIFPRYHQLDVVRKLEAAARAGAGNPQAFLIQHSAGSGKSNSIAWLAHRLATLHGEDQDRVFTSVIVVTDRTVLDDQLQATIYQFEHKHGVVARIDQDSTQLATALTSGTPIIITTLQKFPFVTEKVGQLPTRRYAIIVDEAHSSQTGEAARTLRETLGTEQAQAQEEEAGETYEDQIAKVMASRGRQKNLAFFAFTATPKAKTLEVFGTKGVDGKPAPFHLYSMRQAIEEGFILDVLRSYTTYKAFYRLAKKGEEDPTVSAKKAAVELARFAALHPYNLAQKAEVIIEHFRTKVRNRIGGRAKAMVVTGSRLHAVRYKQAFDKYLKEKGYADVGVLVAFSGEVADPDVPGHSYRETVMNGGISEKELPEKFASDAFQLLLVANKYQTGFDQPLLHTMYVDKRLSGVQAVQTLSRLNRTSPGKEDTFVLDFVNDAEGIQAAFQPYYEATTLAEAADPQQLYTLQHELDAFGVYWREEVESFARVFYAPKGKAGSGAHAELYRYLQPGVDRFRQRPEEEQERFRNALSGYVRLYAFLAQVMPFSDPDLEKLYAFARALELKLPSAESGGALKVDDDVALAFYRLDRISSEAIVLMAGEPPVGLKSMSDVGTRKAEDEERRLSEIIDVLNERFGTAFTEADQILFDQFVAEAKADAEVMQRAAANPFDNFALSMKAKVEGLMIDRMEQNGAIVTRYLNDEAFRDVAFRELARRIYDELRATPPVSPPA
ncbi:type I restriction endonuclease subunit R [Aggregicoccus sp. 17bor-14]|uniref:type I restriction endonuclease subunit R n=1 Tax=Myxococcaceae TaxID=31 RepID=UPI00129C927A|nr:MULTISPECIES: type I restriction endonuclease [Myxococcaceae]MBF5043176.1 type I restriction endonuclease subunit R [Simulacricoccus sp. 17bor-14]MRI88934.1 type I restriction endonuclease subunit R [Aggregicoccus sp. 17bor-14]